MCIMIYNGEYLYIERKHSILLSDNQFTKIQGHRLQGQGHFKFNAQIL